MSSKRRRPELDQSVGALIITRNELALGACFKI